MKKQICDFCGVDIEEGQNEISPNNEEVISLFQTWNDEVKDLQKIKQNG